MSRSLAGRGCWTFCSVWNLCSEKRSRSSCLEPAGTGWLAELLKLRVAERSSEVLRRSDVDDNGANCSAAATRVTHAQSSSGRRIWTRRRSARDQQSRDSSGSERHSKLHRCDPKEFSLDTNSRSTPVVVISAVCSAAHSNIVSDSWITSAKNVLQQMHTALMALTSYVANDIVANSRKNPLEAWRSLQKRCDPTTGGRTRDHLPIISPGRCSLLELRESNAGSATCRATRRR